MKRYWESVSTTDEAKCVQSGLGYSKKDAYKQARKSRRCAAMLTRSFKAKKYINARILRRSSPTPYFLLKFRGQAVFTIKERKWILAKSLSFCTNLNTIPCRETPQPQSR